MPRAIRLPPLRIKSEVTNNDLSNHIDENHGRRRRSILTSSDAKTDVSPIDYILVYHVDENNEKINDYRSERRQRFEDYLEKKQGLVLQHVKEKRSIYVKVHKQFNVLL
jgi:hypothetical protein